MEKHIITISREFGSGGIKKSAEIIESLS
jgi:hypothetical protein